MQILRYLLCSMFSTANLIPEKFVKTPAQKWNFAGTNLCADQKNNYIKDSNSKKTAKLQQLLAKTLTVSFESTLVWIFLSRLTVFYVEKL